MATGTSAKILQAVAQILAGATMAGMGSLSGNVLGRVALGATGDGLGNFPTEGASPLARRFQATSYPEQFAPEPFHVYNVVNIPVPKAKKGETTGNFNQMGKADAATIDEAGEMQSLAEHNAAITQFLRPNMTPQEQRAAINAGLQAEKNLPKFWNESRDRRPFSVSSSAVSGIRLTPDARIEVQWHGSPTWYTFRAYENTQQASRAAKELLKADSIGRAVMPWQRDGKPLNFKDPASVTWWNRKNYDAAYAT